VAYDFGVKRNILRMLVDRGCRLTVVPAQTPAADVLALKPGWHLPLQRPRRPGALRLRHRGHPRLPGNRHSVFGICLGHQLLALASGAKTLKMKFGHHGANHPVQDLENGTVMITSQNHGFAVDEATCPPTCAPRTSRCSMARCRASTAPTSRRSASRVTPKPAPARTMPTACSITSSN
jgi:carbamoyl-phosphate synthase small subunit